VSDRFFIGKVASAAGIGVQTVRYYERLGLIQPPQRTESGYRFIRQAQAVGFRLEEIREILRIKYAGQSPCNCVRDMLQQKLKDVEEQLAALASFRRRLRRTLKRPRTLPRLPHRASAICPLIENISPITKKGGE
jgi:MerR family mercuric resistance operon transcriptional regulator